MPRLEAKVDAEVVTDLSGPIFGRVQSVARKCLLAEKRICAAAKLSSQTATKAAHGTIRAAGRLIEDNEIAA
jgi:hypothetical protein